MATNINIRNFEIYWRELEFDNSVPTTFTFQNYSPVINSEVLIYITRDDTEPDNDSPYFTIPSMATRSDLRTEPNDRVFYATKNGGEFSFYSAEIIKTHNYNIPTEHQRIIINGEYIVYAPEGSMVSIQADPEYNTEKAFVKYHVGDQDTDSGRFRLYGAQQVAYTFTSDTEIVFYGENFAINVLITASQNVSQLSQENQDLLDKLVADLEAAKENMATKDMVEGVYQRTLRDKFLALEKQEIEGSIDTGYFYNRFSDMDTEVSEDEVITALFAVSLFSTNQDIITDTDGVIEIEFKFKGIECEMTRFNTTDPELSRLATRGVFVLNNNRYTTKTDTRCQRMSISLNILDEFKDVVSGFVIPYVKANHTQLKKEYTLVVFDDDIDSSYPLDFSNLYQNVEFVDVEEINKLVESVVLKSPVEEREYNILTVMEDLNEYSLPRTMLIMREGTVLFNMEDDGLYRLVITLNKESHPFKDKPLVPFIIETYEDTIKGDDFLINLPIVSFDENVVEGTSNVVSQAKLRKLIGREYTYLESMLEFLHNIDTTSENNFIRVVYCEY